MGLELPYHRKYRPNNFTEYIGNKKLKTKVMAALDTENKPQVILLQGPAGTGKTSMARLVAKEYLCENRDSVTGACGKCYSCRMMDEFIRTGRSDALPNVREVDVTDNNRKQDISDLLEDAAQPSFDGNWKIYIMDECHAMGPVAQDRLLKELEEPAEKVLMLLCTTNPEQLKETIISRCQYNLKVAKPTKDELIALMQSICKAEGVLCDKRALGLVAAKGEFAPRKSLVELEQVVTAAKEVTYLKTVEVLDMIADKYFFKFYEILIPKHIDTQRYVSFIGKLKEEMDLKQFIESLVSFTIRGIYIINGVMVDALDVSELEQYKKLFSKFEIKDLSYLLDTLLNMRTSMDIEARLLNLGFKGLYSTNNLPVNVAGVNADLLDVSAYTPEQEKAFGNAEYLESTKMTDEDKQKKITDAFKPVGAEDAAKLFGATLVLKS